MSNNKIGRKINWDGIKNSEFADNIGNEALENLITFYKILSPPKTKVTLRLNFSLKKLVGL